MFKNVCFTFFCFIVDLGLVLGQGAPYDFAINTRGERSDELSPAQIAGISFGVIGIVAALLVTILFCYYVRRKQLQDEYSSGSSFLAPRSESNFSAPRKGY